MTYVHKVEKGNIPTCKILGTDIAAIDMKWLIDFTEENLELLKGDYMCVANVHTTVTAYKNPTYQEVQNNGIMAIPDGGPLSSVGRKRGFVNMKRTTGPDYFNEILKVSGEKGYRHFFFGSSQETLELMKDKLCRDYPGISVAGMISPPFRQISEEEDREFIELINISKPDFVWVGLGAPKQEIWMNNHQGIIDGFMVGVGAAFDYFAGNIKRAPKWMQKSNLEWLYRLIQDPKRLFKRYFITNTKFIWKAIILRK